MNINMTWTLPCTHNLDTSGSGTTRVLICQTINSTNWREDIRTTGTFSFTLYLGNTTSLWSTWYTDDGVTEVGMGCPIHSTDRSKDCRTSNIANI